MKRWAGRWMLVLLLTGAAGCATTTAHDPRDPAEGFNRNMHAFNEAFDEAIGKPIATGYRNVVPGPARTWVRNFFANIADLFIGLNSLLQGKPGDMVNDWARFGFNTTIGVFGIFDIASEMGLEKHNEDFGQTFGRWGAETGAYIVWPFFGPSNVRDTFGGLLDLYVDPVRRHKPEDPRTFMVLLRATSQRADLLDASRILEEAALDKYVFQRDAYLQRRRGLVHDGNPPREAPPSSRRPEGPGADRLLEEPALRAAAYEPKVPANYDAVLAASQVR